MALAAAIVASLLLAPAAHADNEAIVTDEMAGYLEVMDYSGGVIFAYQIRRYKWPKMLMFAANEAILKSKLVLI